MAAMRVRKPAEARKAEIVEAALRLADELGPERLTTSAVAEAVGLTQPGVFRHFPKKQDLWEAVAARAGAMMEARWKKAGRRETSPTGRLLALIVAQLQLIQSNPAIPAILFSRELHVRNQDLRKAFHGLLGRFHRVLSTLATSARDAGELRSDIEPEDTAFLIVGVVQGLVVRWSIGGRVFDLPAEGRRLVALQLRLMAPDYQGAER